MAVPLRSDPWQRPVPESARGRSTIAVRFLLATAFAAVGPAWAVWANGANGRHAAWWFVLLAAVLVAVVASQSPVRWWGLPAFGGALALGAALTVPLVGRAPVAVVAVGAVVSSACFVGWRPWAGVPERRQPGAVLAVPLLAAAEIGWLRSTRAVPFLVLAGCSLAVVAAYHAWPERLARWTTRVDDAIQTVVRVAVAVVLFVLAVPFIYLPGAIARLLAWPRRSAGGSWEPGSTLARQRRDAVRPFAAPPPQVARWRHLASAVVVLALAAAILVERPDDGGSVPFVTVKPPEQSLADRLDAVPYRDRAAFRGVDYADELEEDTFATKLVPDEVTGYRTADVATPLVNVEGGVRRTASSSCAGCPVARLWLAGGSLVFGVGQRDEHTIASQLVEQAAARGIALEVTNLGVPGWTLTQEQAAVAQRLAAGGPRPDVVVFLDGYNDSLATLVDLLSDGEVPPGPAVLDNDKAQRLLDRQRSDAVGDFPAAEYGQRAAQRYAETAGPFDEVLEAQGIEVFRFFQPDASSSPVQRRAVEALGALPDGFYDTSQMDAVLGSSAEALADDGVSQDLRASLDDLDEPVFLDTSHVNEDGAGLLAAAVSEAVGSTLASRAR